MEVSDNGVSMVTMLFNSVWYTVGGTLLGVFVSSMTAHVTAKYDFPGKKVVYGISVFVMMLISWSGSAGIVIFAVPIA